MTDRPALRLVVWNLAGGAAGKLERVVELRPDVAIVPECSWPETIEPVVKDLDPASTMRWSGTDPNRGLAVIGFNGVELEQLRPAAHHLQWVVPYCVVADDRSFDLLAVWANNRAGEYPGDHYLAGAKPLRQGLSAFRRQLAKGRTVVAGDFNNNVTWDEPFKPANHGYADADLRALGMVSAYHHVHGCDLGHEPDPTYFQNRDPVKAFHIDWCYVPKAWCEGLQVEVGTHADYCQLTADGGISDHAPLIVDFPPPVS